MENQNKNIVLEKFCTDIENSAIYAYNPKFMSFHFQLRRYDKKDEKLEFIQSRKKEILKYLEGSKYELEFPQYKDFEANLKEALRKYYKHFPILKLAKGWEFNKGTKKGEFGINIHTRIISVFPEKPLIGSDPWFSFAEFEIFKDLPEYIAFNLLLKELKKEEQKLNIKPELQIETSDQESNELLTNYRNEQLSNLFDSLNKGKQRIDPNRKDDFIKLFIDEKLDNWKQIIWIGSNPELATLVFKLTGIDPKPLIINKYFETKHKYDSNSHSRTRIENHAITMIVKKILV